MLPLAPKTATLRFIRVFSGRQTAFPYSFPRMTPRFPAMSETTSSTPRISESVIKSEVP